MFYWLLRIRLFITLNWKQDLNYLSSLKSDSEFLEQFSDNFIGSVLSDTIYFLPSFYDSTVSNDWLFTLLLIQLSLRIKEKLDFQVLFYY